MGLLAVLGALGWFLWRKYLIPSPNPEVAFRRLALLGALGSLGPQAHQTPFQYRERLEQVLPTHRQQFSIIVNTYVRHLYGRKELSVHDQDRLTGAWLALRGSLLWWVLRRKK